jgi:hypothetical protein
METLIAVVVCMTLAQHAPAQQRTPPKRIREEMAHMGVKYVPYRGPKWDYKVESRYQISEWGAESGQCSKGNEPCNFEHGLKSMAMSGGNLSPLTLRAHSYSSDRRSELH